MSPSPTPVTATLARCAAGLILVFATTACSTGPAIAPSATPGEPTALPSARPSASVSVPPATVRPSSPTPASAPPPPAPSASIAAAPTPEPIGPPADGWSRPIQVGAPGRCPTVSALIDATGRNHVAAGCDGGIRVFVESGAGWDDTTFAPPSKRQENDPQLALDGDLLYLAYTRISVEEGGCGDFGLRDVGVYLRTKSLPNGEWSEPTQIGAVADHVQSLRVVDGTIHATVANEADGRRYYETQRGDQYRRYEILNAVGEVALRIGDDVRARVAYEAADAIWYGTFTAGNLTAVKVTGTSRGLPAGPRSRRRGPTVSHVEPRLARRRVHGTWSTAGGRNMVFDARRRHVAVRTTDVVAKRCIANGRRGRRSSPCGHRRSQGRLHDEGRQRTMVQANARRSAAAGSGYPPRS